MFRSEKWKRCIASILLALFLAPVALGVLLLAAHCLIAWLVPEPIRGARLIFFSYPRDIGEMKLPPGTKVRLDYPKTEDGSVIFFQPQRITIDLPEGEDIVYLFEGEAWQRVASDAEGPPCETLAAGERGGEGCGGLPPLRPGMGIPRAPLVRRTRPMRSARRGGEVSARPRRPSGAGGDRPFSCSPAGFHGPISSAALSFRRTADSDSIDRGAPHR